VQVAHASGYVADHVNYLSLGGLKDWQLLPVIREREYTFVTNNGADFALFGKEPLHPGIIIIVPNVTPVLQRELFKTALGHIGARDLTNSVVEVKYVRKIGQNEAECCQLCCQLAPANLMAKHGGVESARTPGARVLEMPDAR